MSTLWHPDVPYVWDALGWNKGNSKASKQAVTAMMSESVQLLRSILSKCFQPQADLCTNLCIPDPLNVMQQTAWFTGHCHHCAPGTTTCECELDSESLCDYGQNSDSFQCSIMQCASVAGSSAGDIETSLVWNGTHFQVITNTVSLCLGFIISKVEVGLIFV